MTLSKRILLFMYLLCPYCLAAQQYYNAKIITNTGDTTTGYIKYKAWEYNPYSIKFKLEPDSKPISYSVKDLKGFIVDIGLPLIFRRYVGPISMNDININTITTARDTSFKVDSVFLKTLRMGKVSLYVYDDLLKTRLFISDNQSTPVELQYRLYMKDDTRGNGSNTINEDIFKKQLAALAEKYGRMDDKMRVDIDRSAYTEAAIATLVDKINGYTGPDPSVGNSLASPPKTKLAIMLAIFAVVAYLTFSVIHK